MSAAPPATARFRSAIRMLQKHGEVAMKPQFVNEKWRSPIVSKRVVAVIRKHAIKDGTYGAFNPETGKGWDPMWDNPGKIKTLRKPRETKRERTREARAVRIENLLETADENIEKYRLEKEAAKPDKGIEYWVKQITKKKGGR